ncbi:MAG: 16S rRNA processing protein RimM [Ardenticatenales bacterium]|nr:16S rRNA processing protein RimM [Ardenticatenales bacterium]
MSEDEEWITIGKISSAHGIRGEVKLSLFVDESDFLADLEILFLEGRPRKEIAIKQVRLQQTQAILHIAGVEDRNEAERLRGRLVSIPLSWLPALSEDEYYVAEIIGLSVETAEGERLGEVAEVMFTGANEVYVIRGGERGEILLPAIESVIQSVDLEAERILVVVPEGLLD